MFFDIKIYFYLLMKPLFVFIFFIYLYVCLVSKISKSFDRKKDIFSDFIRHTFKKFKCKFYHSPKGYTFSFWPCYIRYVLLIIDKFLVKLMPLLHLPLKTTYRFMYLRHLFTILLSLYIFLS